MRPSTLIIAAALLGQTATAAMAQQARSRVDPAAMDIAGVRIGMPAVEAQAALAGTYRCETDTNSLTFDEKVQLEVDKRGGQNIWAREGTGVRASECTGPSGERLRIAFAHGASGGVVDTIALSIPLRRVDRAELIQQLRTRYGVPPVGTVEGGCWPTSGDDCSIFVDAPWFRTSVSGEYANLGAERGRAAGAFDEAAVQAAADRIAPKRSGAAF